MEESLPVGAVWRERERERDRERETERERVHVYGTCIRIHVHVATCTRHVFALLNNAIYKLGHSQWPL